YMLSLHGGVYYASLLDATPYYSSPRVIQLSIVLSSIPLRFSLNSLWIRPNSILEPRFSPLPLPL
ncbi:unnamed protein product, partial [Citrullus colocynthis]